MREVINLDEVGLEELILVTGSFLFAGNKLEEVETEIIMKLLNLAEDELVYRATGIPKNEVVH